MDRVGYLALSHDLRPIRLDWQSARGGERLRVPTSSAAMVTVWLVTITGKIFAYDL